MAGGSDLLRGVSPWRPRSRDIVCYRADHGSVDSCMESNERAGARPILHHSVGPRPSEHALGAETSCLFVAVPDDRSVSAHQATVCVAPSPFPRMGELSRWRS